jgi:hypothetical protein
VGRAFVNPALDLMLIGGGLSLAVAVALWFGGLGDASLVLAGSFPTLILLSTSAHFAASTVRLYTKPGAAAELRFLALGLPLVTVLLLTLCLWRSDEVGRHVMALYLTWSPYHYARQAYGLSLMYCYRTGSALTDTEKRLLLLTALTPFFYAFFSSSGSGMEWFVSPLTLLAHPALNFLHIALVQVLRIAVFVLPLALFAHLLIRGRPLPLVSLMILVSNGIWWILFVYMNAFAWATIFHGLQYLAITLIFHVRERTARPDNRRSGLVHALAFYACCVPLGYALFQLWPYAYLAVGFGWAESAMLTTAAVNIHHFVVDAYIWRLRKDPNYRVVTGALAPA